MVVKVLPSAEHPSVNSFSDRLFLSPRETVDVSRSSRVRESDYLLHLCNSLIVMRLLSNKGFDSAAV